MQTRLVSLELTGSYRFKMNILRAISIKQPFVELILQGKKKKEFRSKPTHIRGRVLLYASQRQGGSPAQLRQTGKSFEELPKGMVVGSVEIVGCNYNSRTGWHEYKLKAPKRLRRYWKPTNHPSPKFWFPRAK